MIKYGRGIRHKRRNGKFRAAPHKSAARRRGLFAALLPSPLIALTVSHTTRPWRRSRHSARIRVTKLPRSAVLLCDKHDSIILAQSSSRNHPRGRQPGGAHVVPICERFSLPPIESLHCTWTVIHYCLWRLAGSRDYHFWFLTRVVNARQTWTPNSNVAHHKSCPVLVQFIYTADTSLATFHN